MNIIEEKVENLSFLQSQVCYYEREKGELSGTYHATELLEKKRRR